MPQPKDIFEKVDPAPPGPAAPRSVQPAVRQPLQPQPVQPLPRPGRLPILVGGAVLLVLGIGAAAFLLNRSPTATNAPATTTNQASPGSSVTTNTTASTPTPVITPVADKDADGLTDDREQELGTNLTKADTDSDGLGDGEEVNVYKTDPKRPDTDSDGRVDGEEVKKGYNPNGPGLLLDLNAARQKLPQ